MHEKYDATLDKQLKARFDEFQKQFDQQNPQFQHNKWNTYQMVKSLCYGEIVFGEITPKCGGLRTKKLMPKIIKSFNLS